MLSPKNPFARRYSSVLSLMVLFFLTSCGSTIQRSTQASLPSADGILEKARHASLTDASFTFNYSQDAIVSGGTQSATAVGRGNLTANPRRSYIYQSMSSQGATTSVETISDTMHIYQRVVSSTRWDQEPLPDESDPDQYLSSLTNFLNYNSYNHSTFDNEFLHGHMTYHVKSIQPVSSPQGNGTNSFELWLSQDNYFPLQFKMQKNGTGNSEFGEFTSSTTTTITFTQWNSGIIISIPQT